MNVNWSLPLQQLRFFTKMDRVTLMVFSLVLVSGRLLPFGRPDYEFGHIEDAGKNSSPKEPANFLSDAFIDSINKMNTTWKAGRNFHPSVTPDYLKGLMGVLEPDSSYKQPIMGSFSYENTDLPDKFDAREKWPNCPTIKEIYSQGCCGSSWAVAVAGTISDRICIHSNGSQNVQLSAQDLIFCCSDCGYGCAGGEPKDAWNYWIQHGIVSGGPFNSSQGCVPYEIGSCKHHLNASRPASEVDGYRPECKRQCQASYKKPYGQDLHYGNRSYPVENSENAIKKEIMSNGPVQGVMKVYEKFLYYKSGVYLCEERGTPVLYQAVRILGWGVEESVPYWLVANSWSTYWGDHGYFKIRRGDNQCGIQRNLMAGLPKL